MPPVLIKPGVGVMRAEVNGVQVRPGQFQLLFQNPMYLVQKAFREVAPSNAALVGDEYDTEAGIVEPADRGRSPGINAKSPDVIDISRFVAHGTVAIEKDRAWHLSSLEMPSQLMNRKDREASADPAMFRCHD
jgi:hypothetical protein